MSAERRHPSAHPPFLAPEYRSTTLRAPRRPPLRIPYGPAETSGPDGAALVHGRDAREASDLTRQGAGEPLGERIVVHGRILDATGRPLPRVLVEIWQANAAGRYAHAVDRHPAPLDPNFPGAGFCLTDADGAFRFVTIKPGAYPWKNDPNAWRPAHVHFSVHGRAFSQRLVTQMYFPGDPLLSADPIFNSVPDPAGRERMISRFDWDATEDHWQLGFTWDIVLRGPTASVFEEPHA